MIRKVHRVLVVMSVVVMALCASAAEVQAQVTSRSGCGVAPSSSQLFAGTIRAFEQVRSRESLGIAAIGGLAALSTRRFDRDVTDNFSRPAMLDDTFKSGAIVGATPFELGAAFAAYGIGRAFDKPCVAQAAAHLVQAQLMAEGLTFAIKQAARRSRPEGSGFSFPSGHTAVTFASATVLQQHFGWRVGIPAYGVASYVAASRVQMKRHYLSDVAFGAAIGIVAGRSVTVGRRHQLMLTPTVVPDGVGASFTWIGKK